MNKQMGRTKKYPPCWQVCKIVVILVLSFGDQPGKLDTVCELA